MANMSIQPKTWQDLQEWMGGRKTRKLGHNTYVNLDANGGYDIRYHNTDIITYHFAGAITLNTGGWDSATTVERLHALTPDSVRVFRENDRTFARLYRGHHYGGFLLDEVRLDVPTTFWPDTTVPAKTACGWT